MSIVELGCGNGRDALFFANKGMNVLAIDQCEEEIKFLSNKYKNLKNIAFRADDFTNLKDSNPPFDIVYSRFTLHSVSKEQETKTLMWAYGNLCPEGYLCIEANGKEIQGNKN